MRFHLRQWHIYTVLWLWVLFISRHQQGFGQHFRFPVERSMGHVGKFHPVYSLVSSA